jgi:hypothetical protein
MKAGHHHHHHVTANPVAERFNSLVHSVKENTSRTTWLVGGLVLLAVVLVYVWRLVAAHAAEQDAERWVAWDQAETVAELTTFADRNADRTPGRLARFQLARYDLAQGLQDLGSNLPQIREAAADRIRRAGESYAKLADESKDTPPLAREALLNAGKAHEALGEVDAAKSFYGRLAQEFPDSEEAKAAQKAVAKLDSEAAELAALRDQFSGKTK